MNRERGSILILAMIVTLMVGALTAAILATTFSQQRSSREGLNRELAYQAGESGAAYYLVKLAAEPDYLATNPAPQAVMCMGSTSFQLESAQSLGASNQWQLALRGISDTVSYRLNAVIGYRQGHIPPRLLAAGTGDPSATVLQLHARGKMG